MGDGWGMNFDAAADRLNGLVAAGVSLLPGLVFGRLVLGPLILPVRGVPRHSAP